MRRLIIVADISEEEWAKTVGLFLDDEDGEIYESTAEDVLHDAVQYASGFALDWEWSGQIG